MQNRNQIVSNSYLEFAAGPGDQSVDVNLQSYPTARTLQTSHAVWIANQKIGETQRYGIERTTRCYAKLAESEAAAVLHRSLKTGRNNRRSHRKNGRHPELVGGFRRANFKVTSTGSL